MNELLESISSQELSEWIAFDRIEPFEDGYWQAALISSTIANCHSTKSHKLADFLPITESSAPNPAEMLAKFRAMASIHNAREKVK